MNDVIAHCIEHCKSRKSRLALPEGDDPRVILAATQMHQQGIATPILLGDANAIKQAAQSASIDIAGIEIFDMSAPIPAQYKDALIGKKRKITADNVASYLDQPVYLSVAMLHSNQADAMVAGAVLPTAKVLAASFAVGSQAGIDTLSSFFLMALKDPHEDVAKTLLFADCALNIAPTEEQLADIAITSAESARKLLRVEPKVAMLSFSTHGSARHSSVSKVAAATQIVRERAPDLKIVGEVQVDAALSPKVAGSKLQHESEVQGDANVLGQYRLQNYPVLRWRSSHRPYSARFC